MEKSYTLVANKEDEEKGEESFGLVKLAELNRKEAIIIGTVLKKGGWTVKAEVSQTKELVIE